MPNFVSEPKALPGPLKNARHERFAQELAKGKSQVEAYAAAGYEPNDSHASRLVGNGRIGERVEELKARAAERTEITVANVTRRLLRIAVKGERFREPSGLSVARAALMDAAKLNGLVSDRHEHTGKNGGPIEYRNLDEPEVDARLASLAEKNDRASVH